jgi:hypothetical protein
MPKDSEAQSPRLHSRRPIVLTRYPSLETKEEVVFSQAFLRGLTLAGIAASLLAVVFNLLYVDVFLRVYELPLPVFASGHLIFCVINTVNDIVIAWWVDTRATQQQQARFAIIGSTGCVLTVAFLAPFFRWSRGLNHFVISISLYDTMSSFMSILIGSVVTDNHQLSDSDRVNVLASGRFTTLVAEFIVARISLEILEFNDMEHLQLFLLLLAIVVCGMFVTAQQIMDASAVQDTSSIDIHFQKFEIKPKRSQQFQSMDLYGTTVGIAIHI